MTDSNRPIDVLLWGASGFTGQLVAEYLARSYGADGSALRWAIGGRSRDKLERVRRQLVAIDGAAADLEIRVADAHDPSSLEALVDGVAVVCTTVGPYARYGSALVDVCAHRGVHYCDLTGEPHWMTRTIADYHDVAIASGARIVHTCGFDSIPSDLGVFVVQQHAQQTLGQPCDEIAFVVMKIRGGLSGGTAASMLDAAEGIGDPQIRRALGDPYALDPPGSPRGPDGSDQRGVGFEPALGVYTAPFIMAAINTRVVRRSNALLGHPYGVRFSYRESMGMGKGAAGFLRAAAFTGAMGGFFAAMAVKPLRRLLADKLMPKPGEGPSAEKRESGGFTVALVGCIDGTPHVRGTVVATKDPGYGATAIMLGESALCLALQGDELPWPGGGVLTPSVAMGAVLVERLRAAGMTLDAEDWR